MAATEPETRMAVVAAPERGAGADTANLPDRRVPVVLIVGAVGAGKTTVAAAVMQDAAVR